MQAIVIKLIRIFTAILPAEANSLFKVKVLPDGMIFNSARL
jgi:hypothetical protein